jgi:hypothetical protein
MKKISFILLFCAQFLFLSAQHPHYLGANLDQQRFQSIPKYQPPATRVFKSDAVQRYFATNNAYYVPAPPPGDQLTENSCVGWAVGYTFFSSYLQRHQTNIVWNASNERSPGFLYHHCKATTDCNSGSNIAGAIQSIADIGDCSLQLMPYVVGDCNVYPSLRQYYNASTVRSPYGHNLDVQNIPHWPPFDAPDGYSGPLWVGISPTDVNAFKSFLLQFNWPIIIGFNVRSSFDIMWGSGGVWTQNTGPVRGGHCICIVGFDDTRGMFKCQNQWGSGPGEGNQGYFWVTYALVSQGCFQEAYGWVKDEGPHPSD